MHFLCKNFLKGQYTNLFFTRRFIFLSLAIFKFWINFFLKMEGFLLNKELDTVRIATALYKRVLTNEWTADRDIEVNNFIETLNRIINENTIRLSA